MSLYLVARVHIRDKERFLDYQNAVLELIAEKQLEVLALDDDAAIVEGEEKVREGSTRGRKVHRCIPIIPARSDLRLPPFTKPWDFQLDFAPLGSF